MIQPLWRTVWRFLKKLEIELPYDPAIPLLGIHPEKTIIQKYTYTPMVIEVLFIIAKTWKQPSCPLIDERIKLWYIYTMKYYSAIKKDEIESVVVKWINLESVKPRVKEVRKRKKYPILMHIYEIWKNGTDEPFAGQE